MSSFKSNANKIWEKMFEIIKKNSHCTLKNLNSEENGKEIYVMKICDLNVINILADNVMKTQKDGIPFIDTKKDLFITFIPNTTQFFINLFCCNVTMEKIYSKFSKYGLALEGCFEINSITLFPFFYQGYKFDTDHILNIKKGTDIISQKSFLVIDNHNIIKIMNGKELQTYEPKGINVQYIEGFKLYDNGNPFMDFSTMKNLRININGTEENINGSNVLIDYNKLQIKIKDTYYNFSEIGKVINFVHNSLFDMDNGLLIFGK